MRAERYGWRARIGIITPGVDLTLMTEWGSRLPEGVFCFTTLMELMETTPQGLLELKERAIAEARKLTSSGMIDLVLFACTSGSFIGGAGYDEVITRELEAATGVPSTTTTSCVLNAFTDLGVKKIVLVGPYIQEVLDIEIQFFEHHGIETLHCKGLGHADVMQIAKTSEEPYIYYRLAKEAHRSAPEADAIFVTCMASPIARMVNTLEQEIGKPLISSCSAAFYGVLKQSGINDPVENYGQLLTMPR
jgi:maleate isomerase